MNTVLVVDDEVKITEVVKSYLEADGYKVYRAYGGKQALNLFKTTNPDAVILDLMLPDISGEEICKEIRKDSRVPIIILTAKSQEEDMLLGLDLGADDYIVKPFSPKELLGRLRAVLRRADENAHLLADILSFNDGYLEIDNAKHAIRVAGRSINVTPNEYKILLTLAKNPTRVFTREELVIKAFGYNYDGQDRSIDTHVKNLRQKIEKNSKNPKLIITVHGVGYKFQGANYGDQA